MWWSKHKIFLEACLQKQPRFQAKTREKKAAQARQAGQQRLHPRNKPTQWIQRLPNPALNHQRITKRTKRVLNDSGPESVNWSLPEAANTFTLQPVFFHVSHYVSADDLVRSIPVRCRWSPNIKKPFGINTSESKTQPLSRSSYYKSPSNQVLSLTWNVMGQHFHADFLRFSRSQNY